MIELQVLSGVYSHITHPASFQLTSPSRPKSSLTESLGAFIRSLSASWRAEEHLGLRHSHSAPHLSDKPPRPGNNKAPNNPGKESRDPAQSQRGASLGSPYSCQIGTKTPARHWNHTPALRSWAYSLT